MLCLTGILSAQTISTFPYFTGFEGAEGNLNENFPAGWVAVDYNSDGLGNSGWEIIKNSVNSVNARTDSTAVHVLANFNVNSDDWFFTPPIQVNGLEPYSMTFYYKTSSFVPSVESMEVYLCTDATSSSVIGEPLWSNSAISNTDYAQGEVNFTTSSDPGVYRFAFHSNSAAFQFVTLIDDVTINNIITNVDEIAQSSIPAVWPNPMDNQLCVMQRENHLTHYQLIDASGRIADRFSGASAGIVRHEVGHVPEGFYLLKNSRTGTVTKCIVEHR